MIFLDEDVPADDESRTTNRVIVVADEATGEQVRQQISERFPASDVIVTSAATGYDYWNPDGTLSAAERRQRKRDAFTAAYASDPQKLTAELRKSPVDSNCFCGKPGVAQRLLGGKRQWVCGHHAKKLGDRLAPIQSPPGTSPNAACPCGSGKKYKRCCRLKI